MIGHIVRVILHGRHYGRGYRAYLRGEEFNYMDTQPWQRGFFEAAVEAGRQECL